MKGNEIACPNCNTANVFNNLSCKYCGAPLGAPNVNAARTSDESTALEARYQQGLKLNNSKKLRDFENTVATDSVVLKNVELDMLRNWVMDPHPCYPYQEAVKRGIAVAKQPENDITRAMVDAALFGSYGYNINFAALAINHIGLVSYGAFSIKLARARIENMASLLEENSYDFVEKASNTVMNPQLPKGFISDWQNKHKLVVAKLHPEVTDVTLSENFARILLHSNSNRWEDRFVEVHIWGALTVDAIESVKQIARLRTSTRGRRKMEHELTLEKVQAILGEKWTD